MHDAGLAHGRIDGDRVLNPEGLRRPDEFVRHKALDAIGDLYVLGGPILGRFEGVLAGHGLNNAVVRALLHGLLAVLIFLGGGGKAAIVGCYANIPFTSSPCTSVSR